MKQINLLTFIFIKFIQKVHAMMVKLSFPTLLISFMDKIHLMLLDYVLYPYLHEALCHVNKSYFQGISNSGIIWIFWWQGKYNMPTIVKKCIESVNNHAGDHKVILLTKFNILQYTNIPKFIYLKMKNKEISLTHFSDILRFNLLNNWGGLWCDATIFCTSKIDKNYFKSFYTCKGYNYKYTTIINGIKGKWDPEFVNKKWTGFLIGGNKHNALFKFMCEYFQLYWKYNKRQIDYFLIDLGLYYAYKHNIGRFREYIKSIGYKNNPKLFDLEYYLNKPYNTLNYKELTKKTNMFKLTYKRKFNGNRISFYNYLLHNKL